MNTATPAYLSVSQTHLNTGSEQHRLAEHKGSEVLQETCLQSNTQETGGTANELRVCVCVSPSYRLSVCETRYLSSVTAVGTLTGDVSHRFRTSARVSRIRTVCDVGERSVCLCVWR